MSISAANELCDRGLVFPATFVVSRSHDGALVFEAIEMDLQAILEIGRISMASTAKHPFIADAFARMQIDQFATKEQVVFDQGYLSQCSLEMLEILLLRSARNWRRQDSKDETFNVRIDPALKAVFTQAEARRQSLAIAERVRDSDSDEARSLRELGSLFDEDQFGDDWKA